jgi:hypothetical protein
MIDPTTSLAFSIAENKSVFALLLGSGVSRSAQIPTGWEIVLDLIRKLAAAEGVMEQADWGAWYTARFERAPTYSALIDAMAQTPDERRSVLHGFIEPSTTDIEEGRKVPTKAHHAIARLVRDGFIRVIITTNFDRLLENALKSAGVEPTVIKSDDDLSGAVPLIHSKCVVLKVHGDYLDTRIRNTEGELGGYSATQHAYLDRILDEHGLVVCGWSGEWDDALCSALTRNPSRRYSTYWATLQTPKGHAADLVAARAARVIPIDGSDEFFEDLQRKVEAIDAAQRPNPVTVDLLVAEAKRLVARAESQVQLHDLLTRESRRLGALVSDSRFELGSNPNADSFPARVAGYEAAIEPMARLLFILGRWGQGDDFDFASTFLRQHGQQPRIAGSTIWMELAAYPGVVGLHAYGLGLLKAGRLSELGNWFRVPLPSPYDQAPDQAVSVLSPTFWGEYSRSWWKVLPDASKDEEFAFQEHLYFQLHAWLASEFASDAEFEALFDTFETAMGFAYLAAGTPFENLKLSTESPDPSNYCQMPIGRVANNFRRRAAAIESIIGEQVRPKFYASGAFTTNPAYLEVAAANLQRIYQRWYGRFRR